MTSLGIVNLLVGFLLFLLLLRFAWNMWFSTAYFPVEWLKADKDGRIDPVLKRIARNYPDKTRFFAWWLQAERLKREGIKGDFAEVGVYKGKSAKAIHRMDPLRKFHLFDTFEGFSGDDLSHEKGDAAGYTSRHFADTHENDVLKHIGGNENIILHKGYFPETAEDARDTRFSLVNLDADLYRPTKAALDFFYERLEPGGVIFVHDHNYRWDGIRQAVSEFSASSGEVPFLLPDPDSTVVIIKKK